MSDDYKITVDGVAKVEDPFDGFGAMEVRFLVEGERSRFIVPVQVNRTLVPDEDWVREAKTLLHRIFTDLSQQTEGWDPPRDEGEE